MTASADFENVFQAETNNSSSRLLLLQKTHVIFCKCGILGYYFTSAKYVFSAFFSCAEIFVE